MQTQTQGSKKSAKKGPNNGKPSENGPRSTANYQKAVTFVLPAGYWDPSQGPIHGKLVGAYEARQKSGKGKGKLRITYMIKLYDRCAARIRTEGANGKTGIEDGDLEAGDLCAVFGSPGLRALNDLYGCSVLIKRLEQKKVLSNGNEMWDFDVSFAGERRALPVRRAFESNEEAVDEDSSEASDPTGFDPDLF